MNDNSKLLQARIVEQREMAKVSEDQRPVYHLSAPVGWMNDPNGFSVYKGEYHLFFQYYPYAAHWGPMHWGHVKSKDLIHWEKLPIAMAPDQAYDEGGCYSGSAIEADDEHVLVYTGVIDHFREDGSHEYRQVQCIAKGDGIEYKKFEGNPVISGDVLPEGSSIKDFRDPKIWKEEDGYYLVVGSRASDECGQILLFRSDDIENWEFVTILDASKKKYGRMWECPDFFPLGDKQILIVSPQDMRAKGYEFHNGNNSMFIYGKYDKSAHTFTRERITSVDYGLDFYAPQTIQTRDGRRIMIAWMQSWDAKVMPENFPWSGMMTVPRELTLKDGKIFQNPVRELLELRKNPVIYEGQEIRKITELDGIHGRVIDLTVEITEFNFQHFGIHFAFNQKYEMLLQYNHYRKCLTIDRTLSGLKRDVVCRRKMNAVPAKDEKGRERLKLRLLLDRFSAEVFVNDGESVTSTIFYTKQEADRILFDTDGYAKINVSKYDLI